MLVLTRRSGERVVITVGGERVTVELVEVKSMRSARLGIQAAPGVRVDREEIEAVRRGGAAGKR